MGPTDPQSRLQVHAVIDASQHLLQPAAQRHAHTRHLCLAAVERLANLRIAQQDFVKPVDNRLDLRSDFGAQGADVGGVALFKANLRLQILDTRSRHGGHYSRHGATRIQAMIVPRSSEASNGVPGRGFLRDFPVDLRDLPTGGPSAIR